jgi:hypothetical protein
LRVRADAVFTMTCVKPRPRVNADARGRPDENDIRTDIFIQKSPL